METLRPESTLVCDESGALLRWQSRGRSRSEFGSSSEADTHWRAIIVENKRVKGRPTQRHIAYLAGFTESATKIDAQRCYIWDDVSARLDQLGKQITPAERKQIEAAFAKKVKRPSVAEYKSIARSNVEMFGWEYLSKSQRLALQDEKEKWQGSA